MNDQVKLVLLVQSKSIQHSDYSVPKYVIQIICVSRYFLGSAGHIYGNMVHVCKK